jgi:ABC-2 type transport system permease protein
MSTAMNSNKFAWLLRREFWEYRGGLFWTPLIIAIGMLAITMLGLITAEFTAHQHAIQLGGMNLDHVVDSIGAGDVAKVHTAIDIGLVGMSTPIGIAFCFIVFFYLLGALYNDRADRSVLFWKSLPLSDTETVLAKVVTASLVAPALATGAMMVLHLGFLVLLSAYFLLHVIGHALLLLWAPTHLIALWLKLLVSIPVNALWALPTIGWLLLCSSFARSKPFLWAVMLPIVTGFLVWWVRVMQAMSLTSGWFWSNIVGRALLSIVPFSWMSKASLTTEQLSINVGDDDDLKMMHHVLSFDSIGAALTMPNLWIGAAAGVAMIAGAIWFRRSRIESYA